MRRNLFEDGGLTVAVARYAAKEVQAPHVDVHCRVSFVLGGALAEETATGAAVLEAGALLFKSNDVVHEDRISPEGADVLSVIFADDGFFATGTVWRPARSATGLRAMAALMRAALAGEGGAVKAATADLMADAAGPVGAGRTPPAWLARLKHDLEEAGFEAVDVGERARDAGCHPVHASRLFRAVFGCSISDHARLHAVRRAQARLAGREPLSTVALAAGFYDQSHMNRVFRRVAGTTPAAWRRLSREATAG